MFLDFVHDQYRTTDEHMIFFSMSNNTLYLHYKNDTHHIELTNLRVPLTMTVEPQYLIDPTMN